MIWPEVPKAGRMLAVASPAADGSPTRRPPPPSVPDMALLRAPSPFPGLPVPPEPDPGPGPVRDPEPSPEPEPGTGPDVLPEPSPDVPGM